MIIVLLFQNSSGIGFKFPIFTVIGLILHSGFIYTALSAATNDFILPTSFSLNKNYLDKFEFSIESKSVTSSCLFVHAPASAINLRISQPKAPAPTKNKL